MQADYEWNDVEAPVQQKIRAPHDGKNWARKNVQSGQFIQPGQVYSRLFRRYTMGPEQLLKETQVENVRIGLPVEILVDALSRDKMDRSRRKNCPTTARS